MELETTNFRAKVFEVRRELRCFPFVGKEGMILGINNFSLPKRNHLRMTSFVSSQF